jgi:hypothetical protein
VKLLFPGIVAGTVGLCAVFAASAAGLAQGAADTEDDTVKIRLSIADATLTATLEDNETARDFPGLLPMTVTLQDYASTEKVHDLPKRLETGDAPPGIDPEIGDITYYAPWGNLAIFYRDFGYAKGLVRLGTIDAGIEALDRPGALEVTIELADD